MATRSYIGIKNSDESITFVYCHFDGYPSHHGPILLGHYNTEERVRALLAGGDMSVLGERYNQPAGHSYNTPVDGCTIYYGRDRGEGNTAPSTEALIPRDERAYLFTPDGAGGGAWTYANGSAAWRALTPELWAGE